MITGCRMVGSWRTGRTRPTRSRWRSSGPRANRDLTDLDLINQTLAVGETEAHLDLLVARGQAQAYKTTK